MVCRNQHVVGLVQSDEVRYRAQTSGTPPTRVLTVNSPQLAASKMAMQNASVRELKTTMYQYYCGSSMHL
jgi:hypothetical protein